MNYRYFLVGIGMLVLTSCGVATDKEKTAIDNPITFKKDYKANVQTKDTLWVIETDTLYFDRNEGFINRPCSNPEYYISYDLHHPIDQMYYYIYDAKLNLQQEGLYSNSIVYNGTESERGAFFDCIYYSYNKRGTLTAMSYMKNGRNFKTELLDGKELLKEITYYEESSGNRKKVERYKKGKLKETRYYTSFSNYYTIKAGE